MTSYLVTPLHPDNMISCNALDIRICLSFRYEGAHSTHNKAHSSVMLLFANMYKLVLQEPAFFYIFEPAE